MFITVQTHLTLFCKYFGRNAAN